MGRAVEKYRHFGKGRGCDSCTNRNVFMSLVFVQGTIVVSVFYSTSGNLRLGSEQYKWYLNVVVLDEERRLNSNAYICPRICAKKHGCQVNPV